MSQQSTPDRAETQMWGTALAKLLRLAEEFVYILIGHQLVVTSTADNVSRRWLSHVPTSPTGDLEVRLEY